MALVIELEGERLGEADCAVWILSKPQDGADGTLMYDLMEKRLASMVDRPCARQLWAMKPAFSSAKQIASSPSFQFQLGMFSRWACGYTGQHDGGLNSTPAGISNMCINEKQDFRFHLLRFQK